VCGFAGILHWGAIADAPHRVGRMARSLWHRGPDDAGAMDDPDLALGFARLSIVDIEGGHQPMTDAAGETVVVYNGEIYNHRALRRELEQHGCVFRSDHSDTEVLVHGYRVWGESLPGRLNGMFAFAIWDRPRRRLLLARDRYGIKPLYLARLDGGRVAFASETRALFASGLVAREVRPGAVLEYFSLQNFWHGRTPYHGIEMFPAAHYELLERESARRTRYWDFDFRRDAALSLEAAARTHRELLSGAVHRQLDADVPVHAYLSGGIDSGAIVAAAHREVGSLTGYTCIFNLDQVVVDRSVDERRFARAVRDHLHISGVELQVQPDALEHALDSMIGALEYPRMGMAYVNSLIAQRVAADGKVVLSGMGGDELHGGYIDRYNWVLGEPPRKRDLRSRLAGMLGREAAAGPAPMERYADLLTVPLKPDLQDAAFVPEFLEEARREFSLGDVLSGALASAPGEDALDTVMYVDATTYLQGLLVLEDKLSMAHSLETRVPLLDNELVDFVLTLPWDLLRNGPRGKVVFRESTRPWLPGEIREKPKMGFGPPDASWYRTALRDWIREYLSPQRIRARGVLRPEFVSSVLAEHFAGTRNHVSLIWSLLSFESWSRQQGLFGS